MDFSRFLHLLKRNKLILVLVPLLTILAAYFIVKELPDQYKSQATIATGLVDKTDQGYSFVKEISQVAEINQDFQNIIQNFLLKRIVDQVSYQLILHDLKNESEAFCKPSNIIKELSPQEKQQAIQTYTRKLQRHEELSELNLKEGKLIEILKSVDYDAATLTKNFIIYRIQDSDFIIVQFEGTDSRLTAFAVNTLCNEFINNFSFRLQSSNTKSIELLESFMLEKMNTLNSRMDKLKSYKIQNRVLNLNEQARSLYGQIADFETKKEAALKDVVSYTAAIKNIDNKFNPADRKYLESSMTAINQDIITTKQRLKSTNDAYFRSNYDSKLKSIVDSLQNKLTEQINASTDKYIYNPLSVKGDLISQKLQLEISLELAQNSISSIQQELDRLNRKFDQLVPNEASIQRYETSIDIASKEYIEALQRYNEAKMMSLSTLQLRLIEKATLGIISPSKKMLIIIMAGVISFVLCILVFFIIFYFDKSIIQPQELANYTESSVLGYVNILDTDLKQEFWNEPTNNKTVIQYKKLVNSIRFELDKELSGKKILGVTSLSSEEGKTQIIISLAYSFAKIYKKVLLIDGNFDHPSITELCQTSVFIEDILTDPQIIQPKASISIIGNRGGDYSVLELASDKTITTLIQQFTNSFDLVIIETSSLDTLNKAKEWFLFTDKNIAVFEAGQAITASKEPSEDYLKSLDNRFIGWILNKVRYF
ncbi:MAG: Wzz/FepE/Etk N-terminal domain-containing protein [Siphonobacter sp.]